MYAIFVLVNLFIFLFFQKILALIPEEILPLTLPELQNDSNEDGLPCIFVVQLLLNKNILDKSGYEQER